MKIATSSLLALAVCNAFQLKPHEHRHAPRTHCKTLHVGSPPSPLFMSNTDQLTQSITDHPDQICWKTTLANSPNSYVSPSIELITRPPSEGAGTGITAVQDIPANTTIMSLAVDEVPIIDAYDLISGYSKTNSNDDAVMNKLTKSWYGIHSFDVNDKGDVKKSTDSNLSRYDVLDGILAHLTLTRYRDLSPSHTVKDGYILQESRRLGHFLDSMPLFPNIGYTGRDPLEKHPFPTAILFWKEKEFDLLNGTIAQVTIGDKRIASSYRIRDLYEVFLEEHVDLELIDVINAIESSSSTTNSRAFGRNYDIGLKEMKKDNHLLVPMVDKMNHAFDGGNVGWESVLLNESEERAQRAKGESVTFDLVTRRDVSKGDEIFTSYGDKLDTSFLSGYGFFNTAPDRTASSGIPLLPKFLELDPTKPNGPKLDFRNEKVWLPITDAIKKAVDAAMKKKAAEEKAKFDLLAYPISISSTRTANRVRPMYVVTTRIVSEDGIHVSHKATIQKLLPSFRAAASALAQLRYNHQNGIKAPIKLKEMAIAAALKDPNKNWDEEALSLIRAGIQERLTLLKEVGAQNEAWLEKVSVHNFETREARANLARQIRSSEIEVLEVLLAAASDWKQSVW